MRAPFQVHSAQAGLRRQLSSSDAVRQRWIGGHVSAGGHAVPIIETHGHVGGQALGWSGREIGPVN
jgi:hypothetical protein